MPLGSIQLPDLNSGSFSTEQQVRQIFEYMVQLNKKIDFLMQSIDEENMTAEMQQTVANLKEAARDMETKVGSDAFFTVIRQTEEAIELRVQKDEVISSINMSPEEITIQAERISLEGIVTVNGYFQIDLDGKMTATGGNIAGWTIDEGALYTGYNTAEIAPALYLGTRDIAKATAIAGSAARTDWRMKIGSYFGVTANGTVYAQDGDFRGTVSAGRVAYGTDASGTDRGTMPGIAITVRSISGGRMAANTITGSEMEKAYGTLKADMVTVKNLLAGVGTIGTLYVTNLYIAGYKANRFDKTIDGTRIIYFGTS